PAQQQLSALLDDGQAVFDANVAENEVVLRVIPRIGTLSPWASKATDIVKNCGIAGVRRLERGLRFVITPEKGWLSSKKRNAEQLAQLPNVLHDRMAEMVVDQNFTADQLFVELDGKDMRFVGVIGQGQPALDSANQQMGLALSEDEVEY